MLRSRPHRYVEKFVLTADYFCSYSEEFYYASSGTFDMLKNIEGDYKAESSRPERKM